MYNGKITKDMVSERKVPKRVRTQKNAFSTIEKQDNEMKDYKIFDTKIRDKGINRNFYNCNAPVTHRLKR